MLHAGQTNELTLAVCYVECTAPLLEADFVSSYTAGNPHTNVPITGEPPDLDIIALQTTSGLRRPPMSHRKNDLGIPLPYDFAKFVHTA